MSKASRREVVERLRWRYERARRRYRTKLLDQVCELCGYERKYAIKVLGGKRPGPRGRPQGGARIRYGEQERHVIRQIWRWGDYPPQTIISLPVHTAVCRLRAAGAPFVVTALQLLAVGL